jgi:cyclophilin family peptidyl-prolyl cis-trans isomerase
METSDNSNLNTIIGVAVFFLLAVAGLIILSQTDKKSAQESDQSVLNISDEVVDSSGESDLEEDMLSTQNQQSPGLYREAPEMALKEGVDYKAEIKTNKGTITIDLYEEKTPVTVNNFVFLANEGFYNGTRSHRIIKDFMIQFGDPFTKDRDFKEYWGTGDPGYKFNDEPFEGEYSRGTVAMANSGPNTNGSQFFIMHNDNPLPPNYVIFGMISDEESLLVVDAIADTPVSTSKSGEESDPLEDIIIESITILE